MDNMTQEQVQNWRNVLSNMIGPYALIMPEDQIYKYKDKIQNEIDPLNPKQDKE